MAPASHSRLQALPRALAALLLWWTLVWGARAQAPGEAELLAATYNDAMQAFAAQNWAAAITGLDKVIRLMPPDQTGQLQGIFYTLGAAYFNSPNYPKAIETFGEYLKRYPNGERVLEVRWGIAQSHLLGKKFAEAAKLFQALESVAVFREQAMAAQVRCYKELKQPEKAIAVLERLIAPEVKSPTQATGAIELAGFYAAANKPEKAVALLAQLQSKTALIENLVSLNTLAVKLGDEFAEKKAYREAIGAYRAVRPREQVIKLQTERIEMMDRRMDYNLKAATGNAQALAQAQMANQQIKAAQTEQKKLLGEYEKVPDITAALLFRQAVCWYEWDRKWESIVVYDRILKKFPIGPEREPSLYAIVISYADLNQAKSCQRACDEYLKEFPQGENAGTVGYMAGAVALQVQDYPGAESFFGIMLEKVPNSEYKEDMRYLLGNAQFAQGKYAEALKNYQKYVEYYPSGKSIEEVTYRVAVLKVFTGDYGPALDGLNAYLQKYPTGAYVADAGYRVAVCKYAASLYEEVQRNCEEWIKKFANDQMEGEVQSLLGDALAAQNKFEEAAKAYQRSFKVATTNEVINYSLFEANKHLQKLGQWDEVARMFEEFVKARPDHTAVVAAMYWIAKARAREGKPEEAKAILVENLKKYIGEPKREAIEQLLTQLAQLCAKRPRPALGSLAPVPLLAISAAPAPAGGAEGAAPITTPAPAAPPPPPPPPYEPIVELEKQLAPLEAGANGTARARLLFAKAELATATKKPDEAQRILRDIADRFKRDDLSPVLLAQIGDVLLAKGEVDRATEMYSKLREDYPKSDYLDFAYAGLGEIALTKKQYPEALQLFTDTLDKISATTKLKEATLGKARTLLELKRYDEARKLFSQVAGMREWRGDTTAYAVYTLGEIEARQGNWAAAIGHYRRVFVAYQKYRPWVAKSYLRAAESFEKMGKRRDAIENLQEMLRNEKLEKLPEYEEAKRKLQEWGATV